ncbi:ornithine cyclodeaminase [Arthrobacter sp. cf158]|uniref:ornithine cyclodeaminase family protein n=1 Tax=Arthrobacter sp. cf158 TaxID=1761744 RepID=UPI00089AB2A0|nr:ornithine cyclodeaminase family protein [Arthrobacter sp. cf158]SDX49917.1 ornithine cyclodeaminase [Arthrobacter sp. cf158]
MIVLADSEVLQLLDMPAVIDAVRQAQIDHAMGTAALPAPLAAAHPTEDSMFLSMMAASNRDNLAVVKLLADIPSNSKRGLPTQRSTVLAVSASDGKPEAVLSGPSLTRFRTAAATAVATRALARKNSSVAGFVGAGALAHAHLNALSTEMPIQKVLVWSRSTERRHEFARIARERGFEVDVKESPEEIVRESDIVCTLTPSKAPVVRGEWFGAGQHVNAVGAPPRADHREIDTAGISRSSVFVDSLPGALAESGDVLIPLQEGAISHAHFRREIGQVLAGHHPGRVSDKEITLYNSLGTGLQDLAAARLLIDAAKKSGLGTEIDLLK